RSRAERARRRRGGRQGSTGPRQDQQETPAHFQALQTGSPEASPGRPAGIRAVDRRLTSHPSVAVTASAGTGVSAGSLARRAAAAVARRRSRSGGVILKTTRERPWSGYRTPPL